MCGNKIVLSVTVFSLIFAFGFRAVSASAEGGEVAAVRYEAEEAECHNAEIKGKGMIADYGVYSGNGFVGRIDYADSSVTFRVNAEEDGEYELTVAYATDVAGANFKIYNNEGFFCTVSCPYKAGWGSFDKTPPAITGISLREGENLVKVGKGAGYVELDYIEIGARIGDYRPSGTIDNDITRPTPGFTRYEAENGIITNGVIYKTGTYSGTGYVGNLDLNASNVKFEVTVPEDGEYAIGVAYAIDPSFSAATFRLFNESGFYGAVRCELLLGWGEFAKEAIALSKISLREGINTVSLWKGQNYAQLDFIEIGQKIGDYKEKGKAEGNAPPPGEGYVRYEAENGFVVNAVKKGGGYLNDYGNGYYSGMGFVGSLDDDTCYVDIPVSVETSGSYAVRLRYATAAEGAKLSVFAGNYGRGGRYQMYFDFVCDHITDWGTFEEEGTAEFTVGLNTNDFIRIKGTYAEIDFIEVGEKTGDFRAGLTVTEGKVTGVFDDYIFGGGDEDDGYRKLKIASDKGCGAIVCCGYGAAVLSVFAALIKIKKREV